jgi:anti-sigma-K factor RskA
MTQDHPFLDDIAAYALGALDRDETRALEAHLRTCDICGAELTSFRTVSERLPMSVAPQPPAARLRRQIQGHLPSGSSPRPARLGWSFNRVAVGIALVLLAALNVASFAQLRNLRDGYDRIRGQQKTDQAAVAMLAYAGTQFIPIHQGNIAGTLLLNESRDSAVLIVWNLPPLNGDQTYQAWLIDAQGDRTSAGIFRPDAELAYVSKGIFSPGGLSGFTGIGVTVEPAGGSPQPTGERIFKVDF